MNQTAVFDLGRKLAADALSLEMALSCGEEPTDLAVMRLRKQVRVLAADLQAAFAEPQPIKPWSPWTIGAGK